MPKSQKLEALTARLNQIKIDPTSEVGVATLAEVLGSKHSIAIAQAAKLIGEHEIHSLTPQLVNTFDRLMEKAADRDPGCRAKAEIADTLYRLEHRDAEVFLRGLHHVQREPIWGGQVDTAPKLRGALCAGPGEDELSQCDGGAGRFARGCGIGSENWGGQGDRLQ